MLGYAVVTGFAIYEKSYRTRIERAEEVTAVGDTLFFPAQDSVDQTQPMVRFGGDGFYFIGWTEMGDAFMIKAGTDDTHTYPVYKMEGAKGDEAACLYLRIKPNHYAKTKAR